MRQIVVKEGTRVYRWFAWALEIVNKFSIHSDDNPAKDYLAEGTNLCHMLRVMLVWAPLILLFELVVTGFVVYLLVVWPVEKIGIAGFLTDWGIRLAIIVSGYSLAVAYTKLSRAETVEEGIRVMGFLVEAIVAKKRKICPFVTFEKNGVAK